MAAKRKTSPAAKVSRKKKAPAKAVRKTTARKIERVAKAPAAKRKPVRKAKAKSTIEKAEAAVVEMAKGIMPKARKVIRSVRRTISGKK
jgi:hypothetical protein